ncbi:MAG: alpha/beta hydrolase [Acinetobacter sp.]
MSDNHQPILHFAHANGLPSKVYRVMLDRLRQDFEVIEISELGPNPRYPVTQNWTHLIRQVIDSIEQQAQGRPVIGVGHSLGSLLTFLASRQRPELFKQVIMLDPPMMMGKAGFILDIVKVLSPEWLDRLTPAGISKKRRDHWQSRNQAAELLRKKAFFRDFDERCFQDYIQYALTEDKDLGGVKLTIPKMDEVEIFRTNPSYWWRSRRGQPPVNTQSIVGQDSPFLKKGFIQLANKQQGIPYTLTKGGHMFPLEYPEHVADLIKKITQI